MKVSKIASVSGAAFLMAQMASADKLSLNEISDYLNDLKTAEARFEQINDDGTVSTGTVYIKRPGKMRFEYNPPDRALVLASANAVYIFDGKSNQSPETYPLRRTPLSIILGRNVNLGQADMVVGHAFDGKATVITAQDPKHRQYGSIQMKFTGAPVQLRQWIVNDSGGGQTTIILEDLKAGGSLPNTLFDLPEREN